MTRQKAVQTSYRFAILKSDSPDDHLDWVAACEHSKHDIEHQVIELCREDWLEPCVARSFDCLLTRPPASTSILKQLYDERTYVLSAVLGQRIYPKYEETLLYENKRMMAAWLQAKRVPHPRTWIFYDMEEAAQQVASRTGQELIAVEEILEAEFLFNAAMGFYEIPDDEEGQEFMEEIRHVREKHGDLLPPVDEEITDYEMMEDKLVTFVTRLSGADPAATRRHHLDLGVQAR